MVEVNLIPEITARIILNDPVSSKKDRPGWATTNDIQVVGRWPAIDLCVCYFQFNQASRVWSPESGGLRSINAITGRDSQPGQLCIGKVARRGVMHLIFFPVPNFVHHVAASSRVQNLVQV